MFKSKPVWRTREPEKVHDVVIIGGGLHGLACAYYLARDHGIRNVAILERKRLGFGGSGRNTEVFRTNQRAQETLPLYAEAVKLWKVLSSELDFNMLVWQKGVIGLVHNDAGINAMIMRHETQKRLGMVNHLLTPKELKKLIPLLDITDRPDQPVVGGYLNPSGGSIRHDAAVWGFAKGCDRLGVHICEGVEVTGINTRDGKITGVDTNKGRIETPIVLNATGGWSSTITEMVGMDLPVVTFPLQAMVTEPVEPVLDYCVASELYFCYTQQSLKGDLIMGAHWDPWQSYKFYNTYEFASELSYGITQLFPALSNIRVMRSWSGFCDMAPDFVPVMGDTEIEGFYLDVGWGYFGFKSSPICGKVMAEFIATKKRPDLIKAMGIERFYKGELVPETTVTRN